MARRVAVFCESFDNNNFLKGLMQKFGSRLDFIALSPIACHMFDSAGISYSVPEDYIEIPRLPFEPDDTVFSMYRYEAKRTRIFWKQFLDAYWRIAFKGRRSQYVYFGSKESEFANVLQKPENILSTTD